MVGTAQHVHAVLTERLCVLSYSVVLCVFDKLLIQRSGPDLHGEGAEKDDGTAGASWSRGYS